MDRREGGDEINSERRLVVAKENVKKKEWERSESRRWEKGGEKQSFASLGRAAGPWRAFHLRNHEVGKEHI